MELGHLSLDMPPMDVAVTLDMVVEVGSFSLRMPTYYWKWVRHLNNSPERKVHMARMDVCEFFKEMSE